MCSSFYVECIFFYYLVYFVQLLSLPHTSLSICDTSIYLEVFMSFFLFPLLMIVRPFFLWVWMNERMMKTDVQTQYHILVSMSGTSTRDFLLLKRKCYVVAVLVNIFQIYLSYTAWGCWTIYNAQICRVLICLLFP